MSKMIMAMFLLSKSQSGLSSVIPYHGVSNKSNTTGATSAAGTVYPTADFIPDF